jgi:Putative amidoligase enzyme
MLQTLCGCHGGAAGAILKSHETYCLCFHVSVATVEMSTGMKSHILFQAVFYTTTKRIMTTTSLVKRSNKNPFESSDLKVVVDNTYNRIPQREASLDRTQSFYKIHEFTLFVDVISGDPDMIERVLFDMGPSFQPQVFICTCPIYIRQSHTGKLAYRFSTTQTVYGATEATITIRGCGGSKLVVTHQIRLKDLNRFINEGNRSEVYRFEEFRPMPLRMTKIDENQNFGIELELSSPPWIDRSTIADLMPRNAGQIFLPDTYSEGRHTHNDGWKIVLDGSIECNRNMPLCNKFEVVSRILKGGKGLSEIASVIRSLERTELKVNKSMGFHVHIDVSAYDINQLVKICQNFIKVRNLLLKCMF